MSFSISEENYIKAIFHLQKAQSLVTTNEMADHLKTKPASITDMLKKLKAKRLLNYEPYQGFTLNEDGRKLALTIVRKHRLWEYFLVHELKFDWDEVHPIAEQLEHVNSAKLIEKLDSYLGFPKFDPHGDPIPDSNGKMETQCQINLIHLKPNQKAEVSSVGNQSTELLELLRHKKIGIGTELEVIKKFTFDNSIEINIAGYPPFSISHQLAQTLFVKQVL